MVGHYVAERLSEDYEVIAYDKEKREFKGHAKWKYANLPTCFFEVLKDKPDLVINALPGRFGYKMLTKVIESGFDVIDFSFMPENPMQLDYLARKREVTAVVDFGFAPGLCHMMVGQDNLDIEGHRKSEIWVGGLPLNEYDEYRSVFAQEDIMQEYIRPARYLEDDILCAELPFEKAYRHRDWDGFISDGLRTLLETVKIPNLVEYTLRWPKHFQKMQYLKEDGFFDDDHFANTSKVLAEKWMMKPEDRDFSILRVYSYGKNKRIIHELYDEHDGTHHSMARTTGLPVVAMAKEILEGGYPNKGIIPPEFVPAQAPHAYERIFEYLVENGIQIEKQVQYS